eukprot:gene2398-4652_t
MQFGIDGREEFYNDGNQFYQSANFTLALEAYEKALVSDHKTSIGNQQDKIQLNIRILLNISQCHLMLRNYNEVIITCSQILKIDPQNVKALIRSSIAFEFTGDFNRALTTIEKAISLNPPLNMVLEAKKIQHRIKSFIQQDDKILIQDTRPDSLVTDRQTLRLTFLSTPPKEYKFGNVFNVRICITNEFGLWNRNNIMNPESNTPKIIRISCSAIFIRYETSTSTSTTKYGLESVLTPSSDVHIGVDGKVELEISFNLNFPSTYADEIVLLRFHCLDSLYSGTDIADLFSLPITCHLHREDSTSTSTKKEVLDEDKEEAEAVSVSVSLPGEDNDGKEDIYTALCRHAEEVDAQGIRSVDVLNRRVFVFECPGSLGIAGKVWDSTYVLLQYLSDRKELLRGKYVVELGSGTGITGIGVAALSPAAVVITDLEAVVPLLRANILLNQALGTDDSIRQALAVKYSACAHKWGDDVLPLTTAATTTATTTTALASGKRCASLILGSDVVYDPAGYQPLVDTIVSLLKTAGDSIHNDNGEGSGGDCIQPLCILAHRHRHPDDSRFFKMLNKVPNLVVNEITLNTAHSSLSSNNADAHANTGASLQINGCRVLKVYKTHEFTDWRTVLLAELKILRWNAVSTLLVKYRKVKILFRKSSMVCDIHGKSVWHPLLFQSICKSSIVKPDDTIMRIDGDKDVIYYPRFAKRDVISFSSAKRDYYFPSSSRNKLRSSIRVLSTAERNFVMIVLKHIPKSLTFLQALGIHLQDTLTALSKNFNAAINAGTRKLLSYA